MINRRQFSATGLAALLSPVCASAQDRWPAGHVIEVIVPYPPAGGIDLMARLAAKYLPAYLDGAQFVVTNRQGAGGQTGNEAIFVAHPDGFTLGAVASLSLSSIPLERPARWKLEEFTCLANLVDDPGAFWVRADSPIKDMADLRRRAAEKAESVSFGTAAGVGSDDHQLLLAYEEATGVKALHSPYNGTALALRDLLSKQIDVGVYNVSEGVGLLREGQTRCLGQAASSRWRMMAEVPTFREQGVNVVGGSLRGFVAPPGLPDAIAQKLVEVMRRMAEDQAFLTEAEKVNLPLRPIFGSDYRETLLREQQAVKDLFNRRPWKQG